MSQQSLLEQARHELEQLGAFKNELPPIVDLLVKAIPINTIPDRMKLIISISEMISFASQFRRNIWHWDGFELPINATSFVIAGSGDGKDSAVKAVRRCFAVATSNIAEERKTLAKKLAIAAASEAGETPPYEFENYKKFYTPPPPTLIAPTTPQGLIQHLNDIADLPLGAGSIYAGELGDELATNANMLEIVKIIAEVFDTGDKESVYTKGKEFRSKEISAMPLSALFVGSPKYILYDYSVKKKFLIAFESKLARRSFFCYIPKPLPKVDNISLIEATKQERQLSVQANIFKEQISDGVVKVANFHMRKGNELIQIADEVQDLFNIYKLYNDRVSDTINHKYPLSKLVRKHLQWKSLKLAGAFAILEESDTIEIEHYISAIRFCEQLDSDMLIFEQDLFKEQYEVFSDYMQTNATDGKMSFTLHELRKSGYISAQGGPLAKMKELTHLASSYDPEGIYTYDNDGVYYEKIIKVDGLTLSYLPVDNSKIEKAVASGNEVAIAKEKELVAKSAVSGYIPVTVHFADLADMLVSDNAYSPFLFKDNTRGKDNIISGAKFIVLDIDKSNITYTEAHYILQDINHHIVQTSNKNNPFKFRILIELDSVVEVNGMLWKHFYTSIAKSLSFTVDVLPQSQIFYSYADREILSVTDKSPIEVRDHLMLAHDKVTEKPSLTEKALTSSQKLALLDDELTTFSYAFECKENGSLNMLKAAKHARDLGLPKDEIIELLYRINAYWVYPLDESRLQSTLISQIERW